MNSKQTQVVAAVLGIAVVVSIYMYAEVVKAKAAVSAQQSEVATAMLEHAEVLDRGGASAGVQALVRDCSAADRETFDLLLSDLSTLTTSELSTIDALFADCGDYFAMTRSAMVMELEHFVSQYELHALVLEELPFVRSDAAEVAAWQELLELEQERAELSMDLVRLQQSIISTLLAGVSPEEQAVVLLAGEANETREAMSFIGMQIDTLRNEQLTP